MTNLYKKNDVGETMKLSDCKVGHAVIYTPRHAKDVYVMVNYGADHTKATPLCDLIRDDQNG